MDLDFNYMTDEELDELIIQIQEVRKPAKKAERLTFGEMSSGRCRITSWNVE